MYMRPVQASWATAFERISMKHAAEPVTLAVQVRTTIGKGLLKLRKLGSVPANIYGHGASVAIQIDERTVMRLHELHKLVGVMELKVEGQTAAETVLVQRIAVSPRTGKMQHIDFFRLAMDEEIHTRVPLHLVGESPITRANQGVVLPLIEAIEVICLPGAIPASVSVDVSQLTRLDMVLHAHDIILPPGVRLGISPDESIAKAQGQRGEVSAPVAEAAATPAAS